MISCEPGDHKMKLSLYTSSLIFFFNLASAEAQTPPLPTSVPVVAASDQQAQLKSANPKLARNKRIVFDFSRVVLAGLHLDKAGDFLREDYIQHNPNVDTAGFPSCIFKTWRSKSHSGYGPWPCINPGWGRHCNALLRQRTRWSETAGHQVHHNLVRYVPDSRR